MLAFIESEDEARSLSTEMFQKMHGAEEKKQKELVNQFLAKINENVTSRESNPKSKFMSMLILRDVIESCLRPETKFNKLFTLFLTHSLLKSIDSFCDDIDPAKSVEDKGKKYFPGEPEVGNNFIRCNL